MIEYDKEIKSKQNIEGAYGKAIVDDYSDLHINITYLEDPKCAILTNDMNLKNFNNSNIISSEYHDLKATNYEAQEGNVLMLHNSKNPEMFYGDLNHKARQINQNFATAKAEANRAVFSPDQTNNLKSLNPEVLNHPNHPNILKIPNEISSKKPPIWSITNNKVTDKNFHLTENIITIPERILLETNIEDEKSIQQNHFAFPDNSMLNISGMNNTMAQNNTEARSRANSFLTSNTKHNNKNKLKLPTFLEPMQTSSNVLTVPANEYNHTKNLTNLKNNNYEILHDSILRDFDHSILDKNSNTPLNTHNNNILPSHSKLFMVPDADPFETTIPNLEEPNSQLEDPNFHSYLEEASIPAVFLANPLQQPEKVQEPEAFVEAIQEAEEEEVDNEEEETFFDDDKAKYVEFGPIQQVSKTNENEKLKIKSSQALYDLLGKDVIETWSEASRKQKLLKIKQGIKEDKYFQYAFLNADEDLINFKNIPNRNYTKHLESIHSMQTNYLIEEKPTISDFWDLKDIFNIEPDKALISNISTSNSHFFNKESLLAERKAVNEKLLIRPKRTIFNRISTLYDTEVLKQKYFITNEHIVSSQAGIELLGKSQLVEAFVNQNKERKKKAKNANKNIINEPLLAQGNQINWQVDLWRESISDGNSYYRMFMFSYMEHLIVTGNLLKIILYFKNIQQVYENFYNLNKTKNLANENILFNNIKIKSVLIIFNLIINYMRIQDYTKACRILLNAFNAEDCGFDKVIKEISLESFVITALLLILIFIKFKI